MEKLTNLKHSELIDRYPLLIETQSQILDSINLMAESFSNGGKLLTFGNGGSSADAEHFCGELMKGFMHPRPLSKEQLSLFGSNEQSIGKSLQNGLPAISLGVSHSTISAYANDCNPELIYAQQIWALANKDDIAFGISTSGNSKNVVQGLFTAKAKGVHTIALTGKNESDCSKIADITIKAPSEVVFHIQEYHLPIYHCICLELEKMFFGASS